MDFFELMNRHRNRLVDDKMDGLIHLLHAAVLVLVKHLPQLEKARIHSSRQALNKIISKLEYLKFSLLVSWKSNSESFSKFQNSDHEKRSQNGVKTQISV